MRSWMLRAAVCLAVAVSLSTGPFSYALDETIPVAAQIPAQPVASSDEGLISLDFREADIQTVLQALSRKARVNIVTSPQVTGQVTIQLEDVSWERALDTIISTVGLAYEKQDNVIIVSTLEELQARRQAVRALVEIEPVVTKVIRLNYLDAADVKVFLEPQLTAQGRISVLELTGQKGWGFGAAEAGGAGSAAETRSRRDREVARSKAIVITETPTTINRLEEILSKLDVLPQQILIEARVMEVSRDLLQDLGLEVGTGTGSTTISSSSGFVAGTSSRSFSQVSLDKDALADRDRSNIGGSALSNFITPSIFVPKSTGLTAANAGLSLILRQLRGTQLELLLHALEEDVRTNTLSAPHVLTLSGQEARILIGEKFPILNTQVSGESSTTTTTTLDYYQDIGIELFVVPQVSGDKHIDMIIHPVISARNGSVGTNQYPILDVREAETQIIVENGDTVVIGGLLKDVKSKSRIGLPVLGKLPFVGPLFSRATTDLTKIDLLIFITAKTAPVGGLSVDEAALLQKQYEEFLTERVNKQPVKGKRRKKAAPVPAEAEPAATNGGYVYRKD